jgi:hypothetical protein
MAFDTNSAEPSVDVASPGSNEIVRGTVPAVVLLIVMVLATGSIAAVTLDPALMDSLIWENTAAEKSLISAVVCRWEPPTRAPVTVSDPPTVASPVVETD